MKTNPVRVNDTTYYARKDFDLSPILRVTVEVESFQRPPNEGDGIGCRVAILLPVAVWSSGRSLHPDLRFGDRVRIFGFRLDDQDRISQVLNGIWGTHEYAIRDGLEAAQSELEGLFEAWHARADYAEQAVLD